jgi:uncharacterized protein with GYD domain
MEGLMPIYICQGRYTASAERNDHKSRRPNPNRSEAISGGRWKAHQLVLTFGDYDWMVIAEMPSEREMLSAVIAAAEGGSLTDLKTTTALTAEETVQAFQNASRLRTSFKSAGQEAPSRQGRAGQTASVSAQGAANPGEASRRGRKARK